MSEIVQTSFRIPGDLMDRLKWECLRRKTNQTSAVIAGLEMWLDPESGPGTAIPEKTGLGNSWESELSVIWSSAHAADPLLAAKLIEALQLVGNTRARSDSMADRSSGLDALAAAKSATEALDRETRAAQELAAPTTKSHGGSTDATPGNRRIKRT